jgi:hypothetical protein
MSLSHSIRFEIERMVIERWGIWIYGPAPSVEGSDQKTSCLTTAFSKTLIVCVSCVDIGCVSLVHAS